MFHFILRRLFFLIPLLLGITLVVFLLMQLAPGDFLTPKLAERDVSAELIEALRQEYGLNHPWYMQYFYWLKEVLQGNLGYSWAYKLPVQELIGSRLLATFLLSLCALVFAWGVAIPLGVLAAVYKGSLFDRASAGLAYIAISLPEFFLALLAVYLAARTGWFPTGGATSIQYDFLPLSERVLDRLHHLILPALVLGIGSAAGIMRIMRANFLDTIRADYVNTARAKGLPEGVVMFKHVLRNAINPLISTFGLSLAGLLSGALMVEIVMNYPGLGQMLYQAFLSEDRFVVLAAVMMSSTLLVLGNLLADILLAITDPRIRLDTKS